MIRRGRRLRIRARHPHLPIQENLLTQRFLFWARLLSENHYLHHVWRPTRQIAGLRQSEIVESLRTFIDQSTDPTVGEFRQLIPVIAESPAVIRALRRLYEDNRLEQAVREWWITCIVPRYPAEWQGFASELYEFGCRVRPRYVEPDAESPSGWQAERRDDEDFYVSEPVRFSHDVVAVLAALSDTGREPPTERETWYRFHAEQGFYYNADNHEIALGFRGWAERTTAATRAKRQLPGCH